MKPYSKPWISHEEQLNKLINRGIIVTNRIDSIAFLAHTNYYRFSGYGLAFEVERHKFQSGTTFDDLVAAYLFDSRLRILMVEIIELIETDFRSVFSHKFGKRYGAFGHTAASNFFRIEKHQEWSETVENETQRSKELFIEHFNQTYEGFPKLPIWTATEIMSFGTLSKGFSNLKKEDQREIAKRYGVTSSLFSSWIHHCVYIRNLCAHFSRIWDRKWSISPETPRIDDWQSPRVLNDRLFATLLILRQLSKKLSIMSSVTDTWKNKVENLLDQPPNARNAKLVMGLTETGREIEFGDKPNSLRIASKQPGGSFLDMLRVYVA